MVYLDAEFIPAYWRTCHGMSLQVSGIYVFESVTLFFALDGLAAVGTD